MIVASGRNRSMVGRERELACLRACRPAASGGQGCVVLIGGEAGMGKSRLLAAFASELACVRTAVFAQGECLERAARPYGPFRIALALLSTLVVWPPPSAPSLALHALRGLAPETTPGLEAEVPPLEKADLFAGVYGLLKATSDKRATIVALEDLHWADSATLELLEYLAPRISGSRLMIVATFRDDVLTAGTPLAAAIGRIERERNATTISLDPLGRFELHALLSNACEGRKRLDAASLEDIEQRSEGNPLFAEELLKSWFECETRRHELPRSIEALIAERFALLTEPEQRVLVYAAVLGQRFDPELLASIVGSSLAELAPALRRARDLAFIVEEERPGCGLRFRHALTRQALYESHLGLTLRPLHERIARTLEALPDAHHLRLDELAYHWWESGSVDAARDANERAGANAARLGAHVDAAVYFERALTLTTESRERARLMSALGTVERSKGNPDAAIRWCFEAVAEFASAGEFSEAITPLVFGCAELANAIRADEACLALEGFVAKFGARLTPAAEGRLRVNLLLLQSHRIDRALPVELAVAGIANGSPDDETALRHRTAEIVVFAQAGRRTAWRTSVAAADALIAQSSAVRTLDRASSLNFIALTALQLGELTEARRALDDSRMLCTQHGLRPNLAYGDALRATLAFLSGRLEGAREAARSAAGDASYATARAILGGAGPLIGLALEDAALVEATLFTPAAESVLARGLRYQSDLACGSVAAAWIAAGRLAEARTLLEAAVDTLAVVVQGQFLWPLAARYVGSDALGVLLDRIRRVREREDDEVAQAVADHVEAIAGLRDGDGVRRKRFATEAVRRYRTLGWPLYEAQALELGDEVAAARAIYDRCGSIADARRIAHDATAHVPSNARPGRQALTHREREIASLVAEGLTNRRIGERLGIGEKTVERHLSAVYLKLGLRSRAQLAVWITSDLAAGEVRTGAAP